MRAARDALGVAASRAYVVRHRRTPGAFRMRKTTLDEVTRDVVIEPFVRRLSDGEILSLSREAPTHEYFTLRAIIYQAPVRDGYDAVSRFFNDEIAFRALTLETQKLVWAAFDKMQVNHGHEVRNARKDFTQVSLF
jgi:hypothetical protein